MWGKRSKERKALLKSVLTQQPPRLSREKTGQREEAKIIKRIHEIVG
jgi:hypothetical protein